MVSTWSKVRASNSLRSDFKWLQRLSVWDADGYTFKIESDNLVKILSPNLPENKPAAIISDKTLLVTAYDDRIYTPSVAGILLGEKVNTVQAYKIGGELFFKRIPEWGNLRPQYKKYFVGHPLCHGAERHFPCVPQGALFYRATSLPQIAPDGKVLSAPAATRWKSTSAVEEALDIAIPKLQEKIAEAAANGTSDEFIEYECVHPYARSSGEWGEGYPKANQPGDPLPIFQNYNSGFKFIFKKMDDENWRIITGYPQ